MDTGWLELIRVMIALGTWHYFWVFMMKDEHVKRCEMCGRKVW